MAKKLSGVVGIDIGSQHIKIAEVRAKGRDAEVTALGMVDTPEGAVDHTGVYNADAVGEAIKKVLSESGSSIKQAVVSIAGQASVLVRTIEVPRMSGDELKDHMKWEIERNIPFAESNVLSDYKTMPDEDPNSANMDVVFAISPQSAVDTLVDVIKRTKRQISAIDVEPLSMGRCLAQNYEEYGEQLVCVVDMGHKTSAINIYRNGRLLQPRQIPLGGEMFTRAIADTLQISFEEAEELKLSKCRIPQSVIDSAGQAGGFGSPQAFSPFASYGGDDQPFASPFITPELDATVSPFGDTSAVGSADPTTQAPAYGVPEAADGSGSVGSDAGDAYYAPPPTMPAGDSPAPYDAVPGDAAAVDASDTNLPSMNPFEQHESPASVPPAAADQPFEPGAFNPFESADAPIVPVASANEDPEVLRLYNAISNVVDEFMAEVRRSIDYFRSRGGDISRIMFCGGGTKLHGLREYIGASMGLECDNLDPFKRLTYNQKRIAPGYLEDHGQEYAVAVGNGLHIFFE